VVATLDWSTNVEQVEFAAIRRLYDAAASAYAFCATSTLRAVKTYIFEDVPRFLENLMQ
jgi:hypothetical protein